MHSQQSKLNWSSGRSVAAPAPPHNQQRKIPIYFLFEFVSVRPGSYLRWCSSSFEMLEKTSPTFPHYYRSVKAMNTIREAWRLKLSAFRWNLITILINFDWTCRSRHRRRRRRPWCYSFPILIGEGFFLPLVLCISSHVCASGRRSPDESIFSAASGWNRTEWECGFRGNRGFEVGMGRFNYILREWIIGLVPELDGENCWDC